MIGETIDSMIANAMKNDKENVEILRAIKNEFLVYKTSKNSKPFTDSIEVSLLMKMVKQRLDSKDQYLRAGREDLAKKEEKEAEFISSFLPKEPTEFDLEEELLDICMKNDWWFLKEDVEPNEKTCYVPKEFMGKAIKLLKDSFPGAQGKTISEIVKRHLK